MPKKYSRVSQHLRHVNDLVIIVRAHIRKNPFFGKYAIKDNKPPFCPAKNMGIGGQALKDTVFFKRENIGIGSKSGIGIGPIKEKNMDKKALDKAVEEAHKKGYLDISLKIRLDAEFRRETFIQELSGCLDAAEQIIRAYVQKYGRRTQPSKQKKRGLKLRVT